MHRLWVEATAKTRRLLRVLFLWLSALSADPSRAFGRNLRSIQIIMEIDAQRSADWSGSIRNWGVVWGFPSAVLISGLLVDVPARMLMWIIALTWMGTACILNARRCNRTHCRYTGPYYLAMIVPVLALGSGTVAVGFYGWVALACIVLIGSKLIWWASERAWGKFS
jgi:hypothetical protein